MEECREAKLLTLMAIFATLSIICDSVIGLPQLSSGVWCGLIFLMGPIAGIVLRSYDGFVLTLIGILAGHFIYLLGEATMYESFHTRSSHWNHVLRIRV